MKPVFILVAFITLPITCWSQEASIILDTAVVTKAFYADLARKSDRLQGNVVLLFDFLYNQYIPRTDPVKLRLAYNF